MQREVITPSPGQAEMKVCKDCSASFPKTPEFFFVQNTKTGIVFNPYCKPCHRARNRNWGKVNPEKRLEDARKYRAENPERERERHRKAYAANPQKRRDAVRKSYRKHVEKRRAGRIAYGIKHREKEIAYSKQYNLSRHPFKAKQASALARARKYGVLILPVSYQQIYIRDGCKCYICGTALTERQSVFDHVKPMSCGGIHSDLNIKLSCYACNRLKGTGADVKWRKVAARQGFTQG
jgi:5-methylcytosine-specific restriction endonuclease McrA